MGNLCSKSSNEADPFAQPGRVLGSNADAAHQPSRSSLPAGIQSPNKQYTQSGGRTLGGYGTGDGGQESKKSDAAEAARRAAEARSSKQEAEAARGKLMSKLAAQKKQTRGDTLNEISRNERRARDADTSPELRRWD